ncbi:polysaccharide deacetylase family protein [Virgibacillus sp. MSJ-26]|uniref:polysaccharide deacetylase family protein n=1 Tax=Virgibacillus sp. MSJ-26 TaxID=2841522 RepID=UPI00209E36F1|nr:polysaccharide deacetylase family protein [Virgibacillus sp. MSJ-26]
MKRLATTIIIVLLVIGGCSISSSNEDKDSSVDQVKDEENHDDNDNISTSKNEENDEKEEIAEDKEAEDDKEEVSKSMTPLYEVNDVWSIVPIDNANDKVVLLTIDDAPDKYGLEMAHTLKELDAPAIFFVNGHFLETPEKKEELKEIRDMGFMIGNHTVTHAYLPDLSEEEQKEEIVELNDLVEDALDERPKFFRAPNGANTDYTKKIAKEEGMTLMNWSYGYDWEEEYQTKEAITEIMLNTELLSNGSNLLMHDREWTAKALEDIVTGLREQGYELVDPHTIKTE